MNLNDILRKKHAAIYVCVTSRSLFKSEMNCLGKRILTEEFA
jgi:hypothetical protein